jgi:ABC-type glycerol-3-phosphate transport system substrate-binding protein
MICALLLCTNIVAVHAKEARISIGILTTEERQFAAISSMIEQFELAHPKIKVQLDFHSDSNYKNNVLNWLVQGKYSILYWQGGKRLSRVIEQNLLYPIDDLIEPEVLKRHIQPQFLSAVESESSIYAMPFAHYSWGIYYNKVLFDSLDLRVPNNWDEFILLCHKLKKNGHNPLVQGTKDGWPQLAWIDYLTVDVGGAQFREQFIDLGSVSKRALTQITNRFGELLGNGFFFAPDHNWSWQQAISVVLRKQAAMTLMGQFAEGVIPGNMSSNIGYFEFPHSAGQTFQVEVAPMEVWVVPKSAAKTDAVASLLNYLLQDENNIKLATELGWVPVTAGDIPSEYLNSRMKLGYQQIKNAKTLVQFFDRDAAPEFTKHISKGITKSILLDDINYLEESLTGEIYIEPVERSNKPK